MARDRRFDPHAAEAEAANAPSNPNPTTLLTSPGPPSTPTGWDTTLELPARLVLAPNQYGAWAHASSEVTSSVSQRTELWHTRLGVRAGGAVDESDRNAAARTVRAVWTRDPGFDARARPPNPKGDSTPWAALHDGDRANLVFESANFGTTTKLRTPNAIQVNRLILDVAAGVSAGTPYGERLVYAAAAALRW